MFKNIFQKLRRKKQRGAAMLLLVIVLTASALIIASSILFLGLGELDMGYTYQCGEEAFAVVDGCIEETLMRLKLESDYTGGNLDLGDGKCIISIAGDTTNKTIYATSTVNNCSKRIETNIGLISNNITVNTWREK